MNRIYAVTPGAVLALTLTIATVLAENTLVKISADMKVAEAGDGDIVIGRLMSTTSEANQLAAVEVKGKAVHENAVAAAAITAGALVKMAAASGGAQRFAAYVPDGATPDHPSLIVGQALKAASGAGEVFTLLEF